MGNQSGSSLSGSSTMKRAFKKKPLRTILIAGLNNSGKVRSGDERSGELTMHVYGTSTSNVVVNTSSHDSLRSS